MVAKNEHTGHSIQTRDVTDQYRDNYDLIFGKRNKKLVDSEAIKEPNDKEAEVQLLQS